MVQIVTRKKKNGRQAQPDPPQRKGKKSSGEVRRSLRRRNARYNINYDDYEEDDEEEERRMKKVKLVTKIAQERVDSELTRPGYDMADDNEDDEEDDNDRDDSDNNNEEEAAEETEAKVGFKGQVSIAATTSASDMKREVPIPLPDKKSLALILGKLQKKDVYGVYAEPVDPKELPDYHDIVKHPMDFATVRKKLEDGAYSTMEQFESDLFLICSNAMQYNAPDTVYHKQARTIQELARKKIQKVRIKVNTEPSEKESKSEQMIGSYLFPTKQMKKPIPQVSSEPVRTDFSSDAPLATRGDLQNVSNPTQAGKSKKPISTDGPSQPYSSMINNNGEKAEDLQSGNALLSKLGRNVQDENGRTTYTLRNQPSVGSDSIFTTFKSELKQLVSVGLHAEDSYARSLARFAGALGPVAWKVASKRIEQALPAGFKYGQGWVGEYEPLPNPVLMLENQGCKEAAFLPKMQEAATLAKDCGNFHIPVPLGYDFNSPIPVKKAPGKEQTLEQKQSFLGSAGGPTGEGKSYLFDASGKRPSESNNHSAAEDKSSRKNELNHPSKSNLGKPNFLVQNQLFNESVVTSISNKKTGHLQPMPCKKPNSSRGFRSSFSEVMTNGLDSSGLATTASDSVSNPMDRPPTYASCGQEQHLREPIQLMRPSAEKAQNWRPSPNHLTVDSSPVIPSITSSKRTEPKSTPQTTTSVWMCVGAAGVDKQTNEILSPCRNHISAESLYNLAREHHPQVSRFRGETTVSGGSQLQLEKNGFPALAFGTGLQYSGKAYADQAQNRLCVFPQLVTADLSGFQMPSPRQIISPQPQLKQKQALPPDLNISFQSSGSPVMQSPRILVDSQQPDLALQL